MVDKAKKLDGCDKCRYFTGKVKNRRMLFEHIRILGICSCECHKKVKK